MNTLRIALAGSTQHTVLCATALAESPNFEVSWVLTPEPKVLGRKKLRTKNPLHQFAETNHIPLFLLKDKIDSELKTKIQDFCIATPIDFLLVVDFGYFVPEWLLALPKIAPINIHPSALPAWRGSSPGQFSLLYGDTESAVSVIVMNNELDAGPLVAQLPFTIDPVWTQTDYYRHSFEMVSTQLVTILTDFAANPSSATPQPPSSPTPMARRFTRDDGFVDWKVLKQVIAQPGEMVEETDTSSVLLKEIAQHSGWAVTLERATRALSPWPLVWTVIPTVKGQKRMQILATQVTNQGKLELREVKIEGHDTAEWNQVKNLILE
jgi:methionyl-tRNA formyltransferase